MIKMVSYDDFLRVMNDGWNSTVTLPEYETVDKHGGAGRGVATGAGVLVGGLAGGIIGYALTGGNKSKPRKIITDIRVAKKGIVIKKATIEGTDLRIPWENIINIEDVSRMMGLVRLNLTDGSHISMDAVYVKSGWLSNHTFFDEFINYVNEHAKGQPEAGW